MVSNGENVKIKIIESIIDDTTGCVNVNTNSNVELLDSFFLDIKNDASIWIKTTQNTNINRCCIYRCHHDTNVNSFGTNVRIDSTKNTTLNLFSMVLCRHTLDSSLRSYIIYYTADDLLIEQNNYSRNSAVAGAGPMVTSNSNGFVKYVSIGDFFTLKSIALYMYDCLNSFKISNLAIFQGSSSINTNGVVATARTPSITMTESYIIDIINTPYFILDNGAVSVKKSYFSCSKAQYESSILTFEDCKFDLLPDESININGFKLLNTFLCNHANFLFHDCSQRQNLFMNYLIFFIPTILVMQVT